MTFEKQFRAGEELHLHAAELLESIYHNVAIERRASGKKVDIIFHQPHLGRDVRVLVEVKDYSHKLERREISHIWHDYSGVVDTEIPSNLLLVTRLGLTTGADDFLRSQPLIRHLTIWQLEDLTLSLRPYVEELSQAFERSGLSAYYVEARARLVTYGDNNLRQLGKPLSLFDEVEAWIEGDEDQPLAILGGYGSGKSSFSKRLAAHLAKRFLADPRARRPVLIPLGVFTGQTQLEGILGAMFTSDHEITNFSVRRFLEHNRRGRLVVILDGFDEMKHAMTFADFRGQLLELVKLIEPGARVLLLGRPSAFLSGDEHAYVLRGRRRFEGSWSRVAQWPEFREYELESFSREERASFLENYLGYQSRRPGAQLAIDQVKGRVSAAEGVAARDPEVFGKPVHNQLLADLASDPNVSLRRLNEVHSKWALYELFFYTLATNEVSKPARRPIPDDTRLRFLREVAHWLWAERSGVTHFPASELPSSLLAGLPDGHATDEQGKRREYLSGSFLEAKAGGEVFYFPHRSFAEFLVAQWVIANPPGSAGHGGVSRLVRDGVAGFLKEEANRPTLREWAASVGASRDPVSLEYLDTLASAFDAREQFSEIISPRGLKRFVRLFQSAIAPGTLGNELLLDTVRDDDVVASALALVCLIHENFSATAGARSAPVEEVTTYTVAALLQKMFRHERHYIDHASFRIPKELRDWRDVLAPAMRKLRGDVQVARVEVSWEAIHRGAGQLLAGKAVNLAPADEIVVPGAIEVEFATVLELIDPSQREAVVKFFERHNDLGKLTIESKPT